MGLDNFWYLPENIDIIFDPPLQLREFMFHHNRKCSSSFRARFYSIFMINYTGFSLYNDHDNEEVKEILKELEKIDYNKDFGISEIEFNDLKRMFRKYGELGGELKAWY